MPDAAAQETDPAEPQAVRFAVWNASLYRKSAGQLIRDLRTGDCEQAQRIAEIIQRVRPDVLLLCEFDYDAAGQAAELFQQNYLAVSQHGQRPLTYPFRFLGPVNTGVPSGLDLNKDGQADGPEDALGFGAFPGQYGMIVFSRFPIEAAAVRSFQKFLWKDMPEALLPVHPESDAPYYSQPQLNVLRLSSKSHWDVPIRIGDRTVHLLVCHPTPPVFDGPEDRNGRRNHDEIRFFADYVDADRSGYIYDDQQRRGGLSQNALFVIAGDMNADPLDGGSTGQAIGQLLRHRLVRSEPIPASEGAVEQAGRQGKANLKHQGHPAHDTADFADFEIGNLRADYVLPSRSLRVIGCGVFWPRRDQASYRLLDASDHRLVWIDVVW